ncbi:MAG: hypothetical protein P1U85_09940 [Verrucomicrobiales bacterium]|nr:hypothetical protein [Verrucomicrobiales bacterium]
MADKNDFVEVIMSANMWAALRSNGQVVTNDLTQTEEGVAKLLLGAFNFGTIDRRGRLSIHGEMPDHPDVAGGSSAGVFAIPEDIQEVGVEDAMWVAGMAMARLRDGTVRVWGERYERDFDGQKQISRPPAEALTRVEDIAICNYGCATLTEGGRLHLWTHQFSLSQFPTLDSEVVDIERGWTTFRVLLANGKLFEFLGPHGKEGSLLAENIEAMDGRLVLREGSSQWESLDEDEAVRDMLNTRLADFGRVARSSFAVSIGKEKETGEPMVNALWIEPAGN